MVISHWNFAMGQMVVRQIPDSVLEDFRARAKREGLSAEALVRRLIEMEARRMPREEALRRMDELRAMTPRKLESSVPILRAMRDGDDVDP
jgi:plasmid stability protein